MPRQKVIKTPTYQSFPVNNNIRKTGGLNKAWLDSLIKVSAHSLSSFYQPQGYMLRVALKPGVEIESFLHALKYWFAEAVGFPTRHTPLYACKYEVKTLTPSDEEWDHVGNPLLPFHHYHIAIILDGKCSRLSGLSNFLFMKQKDYLQSYYLSKDWSGKVVVHDLTNSFDSWIEHASYLCKVNTSAPVHKPFNTSRI
ncbi:hypothetical protein V8Z77_01220 [Stutzerimonas stutzeri]|uniref:hypothetical protein n=1 Tax=Stutzerimonas stutzeri TaxID=316 RepID=UPI0031DA325E